MELVSQGYTALEFGLLGALCFFVGVLSSLIISGRWVSIRFGKEAVYGFQTKQNQYGEAYDAAQSAIKAEASQIFAELKLRNEEAIQNLRDLAGQFREPSAFDNVSELPERLNA